MNCFFKKTYFLLIASVMVSGAMAQRGVSALAFTVSMPEPATHYYHVSLLCSGFVKDSLDFVLPVWTPGYYQLMAFGKNVEAFGAEAGEKALVWKQVGESSWRVYTHGAEQVTLHYKVKATHAFVGDIYLDEQRGFVTTGALFVYPEGQLRHAVTVKMEPYAGWNRVATGLDTVAGRSHVYYAPDYDVLYDSPFLMGNLDTLSSFRVRGVPHYFVGFQLGDFDRVQFMEDLRKIVTAGVDMMGEIPYKHYTFLAIGPGGGGIEHLNSAAVSFSGSLLKTAAGRQRMYSFLAHEYFHNFNVKRIRPVALGPFDYTKENKTNMLWVSEGFTVYYEYLLLRRAGLMREEELLRAFHNNLVAYENQPGHLFQSATEASYDTWSDGPFGRTGDEVNKTISYYDKGPVLGLLLDFAIRHQTGNRKTLDDVMRTLYETYYKRLGRGFTDVEFQSVCEKMAGVSLHEIFTYASTVNDIDYSKYLGYGGLKIDTVMRVLPGAWTGILLKERDSVLVIDRVEWTSPAWMSGLRGKDVVQTVNGKRVTASGYAGLLRTSMPGDEWTVVYSRDSVLQEVVVKVGQKSERSFVIEPLEGAGVLAKQIKESWERVGL